MTPQRPTQPSLNMKYWSWWGRPDNLFTSTLHIAGRNVSTQKLKSGSFILISLVTCRWKWQALLWMRKCKWEKRWLHQLHFDVTFVCQGAVNVRVRKWVILRMSHCLTLTGIGCVCSSIQILKSIFKKKHPCWTRLDVLKTLLGKHLGDWHLWM